MAKSKVSKKGSGIMKEMRCSEELQAVVKSKTISRGNIMKSIWNYIEKNDLKSSKDGRIIKCDDKLSDLFKKEIKKDRTIAQRGQKIKVPAGRIFMTEMAGALSKHLS
jgi:chromatin remodeling complex protein RSC6